MFQVTDSIFWNEYTHSAFGKFHIMIEALWGEFTIMKSLCQKGGDNGLAWTDVQKSYRKKPQETQREINLYVCKTCAQYLDLKEEAVKLPVFDAKGKRKLIRHKLVIEAETKKTLWMPEEHWDKIHQVS